MAEVDFDPNSLTLDEADLLEDLCDGQPVGEIMVNLLRGKFTTRNLRAVAVILRRRDGDSDATLDDVGATKVTGVVQDLVASGMAAHVLEAAQETAHG